MMATKNGFFEVRVGRQIFETPEVLRLGGQRMVLPQRDWRFWWFSVIGREVGGFGCPAAISSFSSIFLLPKIDVWSPSDLFNEIMPRKPERVRATVASPYMGGCTFWFQAQSNSICFPFVGRLIKIHPQPLLASYFRSPCDRMNFDLFWAQPTVMDRPTRIF